MAPTATVGSGTRAPPAAAAQPGDALQAVGLPPLMALGPGAPEVVIGLIDGPVATAHPDLGGARIRELPGPGGASCQTAESLACTHGTAVAGVLSARRGAPAPAICPGCTLLLRPVFLEGGGDPRAPEASPPALARALVETVAAGARLVNLSLAFTGSWLRPEPELEEALAWASARDALVVAAAGNEGAVGASPVLRHPAVVPVTAHGRDGRLMPLSNVGRSAGRRGVGALGEPVATLGPSPQAPGRLSGTSAAVPFVTGALALLWSAFPAAGASDLRHALAAVHGGRRRALVPPLLDAWATYDDMRGRHAPRPRRRAGRAAPGPSATSRMEVAMAEIDQGLEAKAPSPDPGTPDVPAPEAAPAEPLSAPAGPVAPGQAGPAPAPPAFVFAVGGVAPRFPSLSVEKEFFQAAGRESTEGLTDRQVLQRVLAERANRYLARQLCWVFLIEGLETYILVPRDPADLDLLIGALRPEPGPGDIDVVVGLRGPVAPPEACNGLSVPIVAFDQLWSFDRDALLDALPRPAGLAKTKEAGFRAAAGDLFARMAQIADNAGATDEHRAVNYLACRYPAIYARTAEAFQQGASLTGVEVRPSPLAGVRNIVEVIFTYTNRETDVDDKWFVRVDVSEEFPFLVTKMSSFVER